MGTDRIEEQRRKGRGNTARQPKHYANYLDADAATLQRAIVAAASVGGALRFGYSRDGGAYAIGVYGDGEPYTDFYSPREDLNEFLEDYVKLFEDLQDSFAAKAEVEKKGKKATKT
jgi:hypothetical protein